MDLINNSLIFLNKQISQHELHSLRLIKCIDRAFSLDVQEIFRVQVQRQL
jgi:hypothetical protein